MCLSTKRKLLLKCKGKTIKAR